MTTYYTECAGVGTGQAYYLKPHELTGCPGINAMSSVQLQICYVKLAGTNPECEGAAGITPITPESAGCYERGTQYAYRCEGIDPVRRRNTEVITKTTDCHDYEASDAPAAGIGLDDQRVACVAPYEAIPHHNALLSFKWEACAGWFMRYTFQCLEVLSSVSGS